MSKAAGQSSASRTTDQALALVHEGWNHLQLQRPLAAWASWQRALRVVPEFEAAKQALATLETAADLPAAARAVYRFQAPRDPEQRTRWDATFRKHDLELLPDAADAFASLAEEDPSDASAWFNRALCLAWMGRNAEAIANLDRVVQIRAADRFEEAVAAWTLAEILRQGGGAEALADDLRYSWILEWDATDTEKLRDRSQGLRAVPAPVDPVSGDAQFPGTLLFEWLDPPMPDASAPVISADDLPRVLASVVVLPHSLRLSSPDPETLERVREPLIGALGGVARPIRREATPLPLSLLDASVWTFRQPPGLDPETESRLAREAVEHFYEDLWIHLPRHGLGERSPLEASRDAMASNAVARAKLAAVVRVREQLGARLRTAALYQGYPFDRLRRRLGLAPEEPSLVDADDPSCMSESELDRLDPKSLDDDRLTEAYRSAAALRDDRRTARFASVLVKRNSTGIGRYVSPAVFAALVREAMRANDPERAQQWLDQARSTHGGRDRKTYDLWCAEIYALTGDPDAALATYRTLLEDADVDLSLALDVAEHLLINGYIEHASSLLDLATERALQTGNASALARARDLAGDNLSEDF